MLPSPLAAVWHPTKNGEWNVDDAFPKSVKPAWWQCELGHEWQQRLNGISTMLEKVEAGNSESLCPTCRGAQTVVGKNDLATTHAELVSQFWSEENIVKATEYRSGSSKVVFWRCSDRGHQWSRKIKDQVVQGAVCTVCRRENRRSTVESGSNRKHRTLAEANPQLFAELDFTEFSKLGLDFSKISFGSSKNVPWKCSEGHQWSASVVNRSSRGDGCPYCSGRYAISGNNDVLTTHKNVVEKFWDFEKNMVSPQAVKAGSSKKLWFTCEKKHSWSAAVNDVFLNNYHCPYCSGKRLEVGVNDLATTFPSIVSLWHPTKNEGLTPQQILGTKNKKVWLLCPQKHEWSAEAARFGRSTSKKYSQTFLGCPYCSGKAALKGYNDLAFKFPDLILEWVFDKNDKKPDEVTAYSGYLAWWQCKKGHQWKTSVDHRTLGGTGCPTCSRNQSSSKAEKEIGEFIEAYARTHNSTVSFNNRSLLEGLELDIYLPEKKIAIEYNGVYWHTEEKGGKGRYYHKAKYDACQALDVQLIQVWEDDWNKNPLLVKNMLLHKLGWSVGKTVYARDTMVLPISFEQASQFLENNHIQGRSSGTVYLSLQDKFSGLIVAVMVVKKKNVSGTWEILRYASNGKVVGGFSKLLKTFEKTYLPQKIYTFSDNSVSNGSLYLKNGFVADKILEPDYSYLVDNRRAHKFRYRLKRFKDDPNLKWAEDLTESELAKLNDIYKIWDAGKVRWVKIFTI